ncbi:MAG TPA: hypothetical protein K8U77_06000 [Slackia equolifaciens]|uniref:5-methylcytosine-specific restriction endonuclease system specificity protein McrC n=1 Tax=Slackia equolifaciens TaxID=498718 RepID=A0A9D2UX85_9ACTN|nr:hypothetical protein [Slackia equolifaciens]
MSGRAEDAVLIKNIYYMMAYAFRALEIPDFCRMQTEPFDTLHDLLAAILVAGINAQRRRGFEREYESRNEAMQRVVGHIDMRETVRLSIRQRQEVHCVFDELAENTYKNQVLKTAAWHLLASKDVRPERKRALKRSLILMQEISLIDPSRIAWSRFHYDGNNRSYRLLMNVCYMILHDLLPRDQKGDVELLHALPNDALSALYERFVLEYFRRHHPHLHADAREIPRLIEGEAPSFLPKLATDVTLTNGKKRLIIDTKFYGTILNVHYGKEILSPVNLNQIFSYVLHAQESFEGDVSGMLLYAQTSDTANMREHWVDLHHDFYCYTLDLNVDFVEVAHQLDEIAELLAVSCAFGKQRIERSSVWA